MTVLYQIFVIVGDGCVLLILDNIFCLSSLVVEYLVCSFIMSTYINACKLKTTIPLANQMLYLQCTIYFINHVLAHVQCVFQ